jgi:hypothetical protein
VSTLGTQRILEVHSLLIPPAGGWIADVSLDSTALPPLASTTLTIGDLQLVGAVTSAAYDDHPVGGARPRVLVEGGAGWGLVLARGGAYDAPGGVRLSTVLADLAALAGEAYDAPDDVLLPGQYSWPAPGPYWPVTGRSVLADLVARGAVPLWRVAPSGRTRFDAWPSTGAADGSVRVTSRNLARARRHVACDQRVAALLPGATLEGVEIRRVLIHETASAITAEVYGL